MLAVLNDHNGVKPVPTEGCNLRGASLGDAGKSLKIKQIKPRGLGCGPCS